ncbi:MAG: hypothetical protein OXH93_20645, partial [Caldilineaceae bacterium]|nr:hypothetical protein [Caldilineaceae bacterium]
EGRIGPTAQNCSGQWSEAALPLRQSLTRTGNHSVATRGIGKFTPFLGCTPIYETPAATNRDMV